MLLATPRGQCAHCRAALTICIVTLPSVASLGLRSCHEYRQSAYVIIHGWGLVAMSALLIRKQKSIGFPQAFIPTSRNGICPLGTVTDTCIVRAHRLKGVGSARPTSTSSKAAPMCPLTSSNAASRPWPDSQSMGLLGSGSRTQSTTRARPSSLAVTPGLPRVDTAAYNRPQRHMIVEIGGAAHVCDSRYFMAVRTQGCQHEGGSRGNACTLGNTGVSMRARITNEMGFESMVRGYIRGRLLVRVRVRVRVTSRVGVGIRGARRCTAGIRLHSG